jgi:predicted nucleic acid-binding protein
VVSRLVTEIADPLVVSAYVVAELDYLVAGRVGVDAELAVLEELAGGAHELAQLDASDLQRASAMHRALPGPVDRAGRRVDRRARRIAIAARAG